jgi:hypothetical protein
MDKIKKFLKQYWVFVLLAAVASGLLVLRLSQRGQPSPLVQPPPAPQPGKAQPEIPGISIPQNTQLNLVDFSFPSRLKTYQGTERKISTPQATKIAKEFRFPGSPQKSEAVLGETIYNWSSKTHFLSIALDSGKIEYGLDLYQTQAPTEGLLPSSEEARNILENLLAKLELTPEFELKWQEEEYLLRGFYFLPAPSSEGADFIKVGFNPGIGQHQLVGLDPNEPLVSLILGKGGEIIRFRHQVYFANFAGGKTEDLKSEIEVRGSLITEGKIVAVSAIKKPGKEPEITQAEFNQIRLAYFQEVEKTALIQPVYILSGLGTLSSGEKTELVAYLPALKFEF